ncbi:hypothetical protein [Mycobacterium camsae]|uniref:hypothetical protein n=1 Tax=Mycobacterium gordonae TaxID=1778 RepID=UPI001980B6A1|nr:hypothetical protein [Mycobacterium gordonae]
MNVAAADGGAAGDRRLVEKALSLLIGEAPTGWRRLRVEFAAAPSVVTATVTSDTGTVSLSVPADAVEALNEYHRLAVASGAVWRRLEIQCGADGTIFARTDASDAAAATPVRRWTQRLLAVITVGCLAAAAAVFAVGWRWSEPARLTVIKVPEPSARAQQAWRSVVQWYDAENHGDAARMRRLACVHPAKAVTDWIDTTSHYGQDQGLVFPDAISEFRDNGATVVVKVPVRIRPLDERTKRQVEEAQANGGFFHETVTLASEGDELKICDVALPPRDGG